MVKAKPYKWMYSRLRNGKTIEVRKQPEAMLAVKESLEEMPKTAATFEIKNITRDKTLQSYDIQPMVEYHGGWMLPPRFDAQRRSKKYVNPNHMHATHFAEASSVCECGGYHVNKFIKRHTDDCCPEYRSEAKERIRERRAEIVEEGADLWINQPDLAPRMGFAGQSSVHYFCENHWEKYYPEEMARGREKTFATIKYIHEMRDDLNYEELANMFGIPYETLQKGLYGTNDHYDAIEVVYP